MNTIQEIQSINERELELGIAGTSASWHCTYAKSAWIYFGNVSFDLSEGDILCVLSQYGELDDFWLVRNDETGISRGFGYAKYVDARSCILAVDNLIGIKLCGRPLRVEHVDNMRLPKKLAEQPESSSDRDNKIAIAEQAYDPKDLANQYNIQYGQDLFAPPAPAKVPSPPSEPESPRRHKKKKSRKNDDLKQYKKKEKKRKRSKRSDSSR